MKVKRLALLALVALVAALMAACGGTPGEDTDDDATSAAAPATSEAAPASDTAAASETAAATEEDTAAAETGATETAAEAESSAAETAAAAPAVDVAAAGDVTLTFASSEGGGGQEASLRALVKEFMAKYPNVTVKESYSAFDPFMKRVKLLAAGDDPPDVFAGNQGYGIDAELVKAKLIMPLDTYADAFGWADALGEGTLQQFRWTDGGQQFGEGSIYGVGSAGEAVGLFYNAKKLEALGFDGPPETLAELDEMLAKAKEAGEIPIIGGNQEAWPGLHFWGSVQGQFVDPQTVRDGILGKEGSTYDTPENLKAAQKLEEWAKNGYFNKDVNGKPNDTANAEFVDGQGVFNITGTWQTANFSKNPDIRFANMPKGETGKLAMTGSLSVPYHVSAKSDIPDVAAAFVDFIVNRDAAQTLIDNGRVPAIPTDLPAGTPLNTDAVEAWKALVADDGLAFYPDWSTNTMYDTMSQGVQGILAGDVSAQEFIDRLESDYSEFQSSRGK